jgi:hypothetical protein
MKVSTHALHLVIIASLLAACGGGGASPPPPPAPKSSIPPPTSGTENITPSASATTEPLPNIGGVYGGQIVLPPGSGTAKLTFSLSAPSGVTALTELTPQPQIAYIAITAQSTFALAAVPGLNLTVPNGYMAIDMWLNYYSGTAWSTKELGWPSTTLGVSAMCFATHGGPVSLQQGQSLYFGINGDDVLPTPILTSTPPPCPQ